MEKKFASVINCIDGRVQEPVIRFMKEKYKVDYVDMITEPGVNKILAEDTEKYVIDSIYSRLNISITKHLSNTVAIVGHYDCAACPVDDETNINFIKEAVLKVRACKLPVQVVGLWLDENFNVFEV